MQLESQLEHLWVDVKAGKISKPEVNEIVVILEYF